MRFWWLSVISWLSALTLWFNELAVLVIARNETGFAVWKIWLLIGIWLLIVFSFFHAIFTPPARIPDEYRLETSRMPDQLAEIALNRRSKALFLEEINYCDKCNLLKPTRTHHCRTCNQCIPRMDHHCPILQSCVHNGNHKFYLLYLFWPGVLGVYAVFLCTPVVYRASMRYFFEGIEYTFEEQFIVSAAINALTIIASVTYLLRFQIQNLLQNRTIIEDSKISSAEENEEMHDYSQGDWQDNVSSLMGPRWSWLLPIDTVPGDGVTFQSGLRKASELQ